MESLPVFTLVMSTAIPPADREELMLALRPFVNIQTSIQRVGGPEWETFVAFSKDVGALAGASVAVIKLASVIANWVRNLRDRSVVANAKLQRPDRLEIGLETASEEDVKAWFSSSNPQ